MKKIITLISLFVVLVAQSFANTAPNWGNLVLIADYNEQDESVELHFEVDASMNTENEYYIIINIGGKTYRKTFDFNSTKNMFEVDFEVRDSVPDASYPFSISVQNIHFHEVFSSDAEIVFSDSISESSQSGNAGNATQNVNPYISSPQNSYANTVIVPSNRVSAIPTNRSQSGINPSITPRINFGSNNTISNTVNTKTYNPTTIKRYTNNNQGYIPKYPNRASEPRTINGIGNSSSYSSWRAGK